MPLINKASAPRAGASQSARLRDVTGFGSNPGNLAMRVHVPAQLPPAPALVVVLHGCTQTAESFDCGSGWSKLAERGGFVLLYPEQRKANNPRNCFNWFNPEDTARDSGEPCSIRQMIGKVVADHGIDRGRVFVCGLSAGGAMAGVMLATYPEVFRAGTIIAGLPYGGASSVGEALESMYVGRVNAARTWGDFVRRASGLAGPWPDVAVWHGTVDGTVKPINAGEIVKQWTDVHGVGAATPRESKLGRITRRAWLDAGGRTRVLDYSVPGMAHGVPLDGRDEAEDGALGPFFLAAGLWSTLEIAKDWGLFDRDGKPRRRRRFRLLGFEF